MTNYHPLDVHIGRFLLLPNGIRTIGPNALIKKCKRNNYIQKQLIEFISRDFFSSWLCDNNRKKHGDNVNDFRQSFAASFFLSLANWILCRNGIFHTRMRHFRCTTWTFSSAKFFAFILFSWKQYLVVLYLTFFRHTFDYTRHTRTPSQTRVPWALLFNFNFMFILFAPFVHGQLDFCHL